MPRQTDDFVEEFVAQGFTPIEAAKLVQTALQEGFQDTLNGGREEQIKEFGELDSLTQIRELFTEENEGPGLDIGACLPDGLELKPFECEGLYVPTAGRCFFKAVARALRINNEKQWLDSPVFAKMSPYEQKTRTLKKALSGMGLDWWTEVPAIIRPKDGRWVRMNPNQKAPKRLGFIALTPIGKAYHAVWIEAGIGKNWNFNKENPWTPEAVTEKIQELVGVAHGDVDFTELENEQPNLCGKSGLGPKEITGTVLAYDIECVFEEGLLRPWAVGYAPIPITKTNTMKWDGKKLTHDTPQDQEEMEQAMVDGVGYEMVQGRGCISTFINRLGTMDLENDVGILFAHNGGRFDHLYLLTAKEVFVHQSIESGGVKGAKLTIGKNTIYLRDSMGYTQLSLKESGKALKTKVRKGELDIAGKNEAWYLTNEKIWAPYLRLDVLSLGNILQRLHVCLGVFGESVSSTSLGIAGVAWSVMMKGVAGFNNLRLVKSEATRGFMKKAMYGGRVLHWKKKASDMVSLDGNSLYPSAMAEGVYPIGKYAVLASFDKATGISPQGTLYIAEVTFDAGNRRYTLVPHRGGKGQLIKYPSGQFRGVYTSIDIKEAIALGYEIKEFHQGVVWAYSAKLFTNLITNLYEERSRLKKEGSSLEYTYKILLNAMFGKFAEEYSTVTGFMREDQTPRTNPRRTVRENYLLPNNQRKIKYRLTTPMVRKPQYIASFILSYARRIMNRMIALVGPENIAYSDTDSVYVPESALENPQISSLMHSNLGGFKNDYGDGVVLKDALFLDNKRYFARISGFSRGTAGCIAKFNGLAFKTAFNLTDRLETASREEIDEIEKFYRGLLENPKAPIEKIQERWLRDLKLSGKEVRIDRKSMEFQVDPSRRGTWTDDGFYPPQYCFEQPEDSFKYIPERADPELSFLRDVEGWWREGGGHIHSKTIPSVDRENYTGSVSIAGNPVSSNWVLRGEDIFHYEQGKEGKITYRASSPYGPGVKVDEEEKHKETFLMWIGGQKKGLNLMTDIQNNFLKSLVSRYLQTVVAPPGHV